jgi:predicted Rossmann-fold nucleotide-binding protein
VNGYYDSLKVLINNMVQEGFLEENISEMLLMSDSIDELLDLIRNYEAPQADKLINKAST